ncbi:hypothetical protein F441_17315, partial [Phytophthora nicotianae CJ01A1]
IPIELKRLAKQRDESQATTEALLEYAETVKPDRDRVVRK